jgi:hypothetical protein
MLLGVVLILLGLVMLGGALALSSVRSDTAAAGADRLGRQLFDCAERGLEWGKQFFTGSGLDTGQFLKADVCNNVPSGKVRLPCSATGPFRPSITGAAPATFPGYPYAPPFTTGISIGKVPLTVAGSTFMAPEQQLEYTVAIFDNDEADNDYTHPSDTQVVVYSRCRDPKTGQSKAVQAMVQSTVPSNNDYVGQAGYGFRGQGNQN